MKRFITVALAASMVFAFGVCGIAAAPEISGSAEISLVQGNEDEVEAEVALNGKLEKNFEYNLAVECNTEDNGDTVTSFSEVSLAYVGEAFGVKFGKFAHNPTIMDMLDEDHLAEMDSEGLLQVTAELGKFSTTLTYQAADNTANGPFDKNSFQIEADYNILEGYTIGLNYQDFNDVADSDAGLTFQFEAQPVEFFTLYGEIGNVTGTDDDQALGGFLATYKEFSLRGEHNFDTDVSAARVAYQLAEGLSVQYEYNSDDLNKASVSYEF